MKVCTLDLYHVNGLLITKLAAVAYEKALQRGEVMVSYGRIMFLGPAAVGKTSLKHGLMNKRLPSAPESTIVADVSTVKPVSYEWARAGNTGEDFWKQVTPEDEIMEIAQLMAAVYQSNKDPRAARRLVAVIGSVAATAAVAVVAAPVMALKLTEADREKVEQLKAGSVSEIFQMAMELAKSIPTSNIGREIWLHLWDCGGQPQFLELLPAFLTARTMFLLLFDASEDLHSNWSNVQYRQGKRKELGKEPMSTLDLLLQWMATTFAHLARFDGNNCLLQYPRLLPVGTHGDKIADKEAVKKSLANVCKKSSAFSSIVLQPLIVDNTKAGRGREEDEAFQAIRKEIHNLTLDKLAVKTPITWVLFRKVLQKLEKKVMSMNEVCKIGAACEIPVESIPHVLTFYHELGVVLFYGHIESLHNIVVVDPKWLVEQLGNLLALPGKEKAGDPSMWSLLRSKGILLESLFQALWKDSLQSLKPSAMMDLLVHFLLVAPIPCTGEHPLSPSVKEFFLPMMMESFKGDPSIVERSGSTKAAPLYILFNMGFVPPGFFTRLITTLSMYKEGMVIYPTAADDHKSVLQGDFKIMFDKEIFRNRVTFCYQESGVDEITLTGSARAIQIDVVRCLSVESGPSFRDCCCKVLLAIKHCNQHIGKVLYKNLGSFGRAVTITSDFAFECLSCLPTEVHYCIFEPTHPISRPLRCSSGEYHHGAQEELYWLSADSFHVCGMF